MQQVVDSYCIFSFVDQNRPFGVRAKRNRKNRPFGYFWFAHTIFCEILADSEWSN